MININTNIHLRIILLLVITRGIYGCNNKELFTFEKQNFTVDSMPECKNEDCATIEVGLLKVTDDHATTLAINKQIEQAASTILTIEENTSLTTLPEAIRHFNNSYQDITKEFPDETTPYEASIDCRLGFQCENLISIAMDSYIYTGGAHGYGGVSYLNINPKNGKHLTNQSLFKDYKGFVQHAEVAFRQQNNIEQNDPINSTGFFFENDTFNLPENIGFTNTEVILFYNQYEISSYAEGPVELKLNKEDVASYFAFDIL